MEKLIFLAAIGDELNPLKNSLKSSSLIDRVEIDFIELGVGVINSIITLGQHIKRFPKNSRVVLVGTAGILGKDFVPGDVCQASVFRWASVGLALNQGYLPESLYPAIPARVLKASPNKSKGISVITTPEITSGEEGARALQNQHAPCLENLEAYGIAFLLKKHNIPLSGFFSVTNRVGPESHNEYMEYRKLAWSNLAKVVPHMSNCW
ncbi:MAG: hypothetical protein J7M06_01670 [Proteobacteria bacterium]|nr:hypothetical protein [Pseudomonadota bacterium]